MTNVYTRLGHVQVSILNYLKTNPGHQLISADAHVFKALQSLERRGFIQLINSVKSKTTNKTICTVCIITDSI